MPSLDGYSLNKEIEKLREDVFKELISMREAFREIYHYLDSMEQQKKEASCRAQENATKSKTKKKEKTASTTEGSIESQEKIIKAKA